jgi:hypothetical protein
MNLLGVNAPFISLFTLAHEVFSLPATKVWFHNRDKALYITLHYITSLVNM